MSLNISSPETEHSCFKLSHDPNQNREDITNNIQTTYYVPVNYHGGDFRRYDSSHAESFSYLDQEVNEKEIVKSYTMESRDLAVLDEAGISTGSCFGFREPVWRFRVPVFFVMCPIFLLCITNIVYAPY